MAAKKKPLMKKRRAAKTQDGGRIHLRAVSKDRVQEYHALAGRSGTSLTALVTSYLDQLLEAEKRGLFDAEQI